MARIRTIKPDFFTSPKVARVSRDARLFFAGLLTDADDEGRVLANAKRLAGCLFPFDDDVTAGMVNAWITELDAAGMVAAYLGPDGTKYLVIVGFKEHQRVSHPTASKLPQPPRDLFARRSGDPPENLRPEVEVEVEQGSGGGSAPDPVEEETARRIARRRAKGEDIGPKLEQLIRDDVIRDLASRPAEPRPPDPAAAARNLGANRAGVIEERELQEELRTKFGDDDELVAVGVDAFRRALNGRTEATT